MSVAFLDTNILLYLFERVDTAKRTIAAGIIEKSLADGTGILSFQVVQETLQAITHKAKVNAGPEAARRFFEDVLSRLWKVMPSASLYRRALEVQERYRFGFYDSLVVAAALGAGCSTLYTEDLQHGQIIDGLTIINPFRV